MYRGHGGVDNAVARVEHGSAALRASADHLTEALHKRLRALIPKSPPDPKAPRTKAASGQQRLNTLDDSATLSERKEGVARRRRSDLSAPLRECIALS